MSFTNLFVSQNLQMIVKPLGPSTEVKHEKPVLTVRKEVVPVFGLWLRF